MCVYDAGVYLVSTNRLRTRGNAPTGALQQQGRRASKVTLLLRIRVSPQQTREDSSSRRKTSSRKSNLNRKKISNRMSSRMKTSSRMSNRLKSSRKMDSRKKSNSKMDSSRMSSSKKRTLTRVAGWRCQVQKSGLKSESGLSARAAAERSIHWQGRVSPMLTGLRWVCKDWALRPM